MAEEPASPGERGYSCGQLNIASPGEGGGCGVPGTPTSLLSHPDMGSSVVKKVRPRRRGSPKSLSSSQVSSDDIPLPKILHLYFDGDANKILADKREAHRIVQGAFSNFTTGQPQFDGRIRKVNLHPNKKSVFL